jgi:hypothetical protein
MIPPELEQSPFAKKASPWPSKAVTIRRTAVSGGKNPNPISSIKPMGGN